jgi:predicted butyrate kinase (DUF1464 family)
MPRVAGTDPGTSSLDLVVLENGRVTDQCRFSPEQLRADVLLPVRWLKERGPFHLIAGPSGYGLPLVRSENCTDREIKLMALVRPDEKGQTQGVERFSALLRALCAADLPIVFLPGVIHLPTVPGHRKINRIDLGTADKLCVAALALHQQAAQVGGRFDACTFGVIELGSAFTACVVVRAGRIVDGLGGTSGPVGWRSAGAWDGEVAYLFSPLAKQDLFQGGAVNQPDAEEGLAWFRESLLKAVAGLQAVTSFDHIILSGQLLDSQPILAEAVANDLAGRAFVTRLESLPGAWVKHAAQGAALIADGLAGGSAAPLVDHLRLRGASCTVLDWLRHPRAAEVRSAFQGGDAATSGD